MSVMQGTNFFNPVPCALNLWLFFYTHAPSLLPDFHDVYSFQQLHLQHAQKPATA
jgi:hypothetical protein